MPELYVEQNHLVIWKKNFMTGFTLQWHILEIKIKAIKLNVYFAETLVLKNTRLKYQLKYK